MRIKSLLMVLVIIVCAGAYYWYSKGGARGGVSDLAENPVYKAWAACKTGSTATYQISSGKDTYTSTRTLVEILPAMVIFSDHATGPDKPRDETHVAFARIDPKDLGLPQAGDVFFTIIDSSTASKDTVSVKGASVPATLHTFSTWIFDPDKKIIIKSWTSEEYPGGVIKMEGKSLKWELTDFSKAANDSPRPAQDFEDSTPKGLLRMLDRQGFEKGREFIASLYDTSKPSAKPYAEARSRYEFALLTLEDGARKRFGEATTVTETIDRFAHHQSRSDIETGTQFIENNKAAVVYDLEHSVRMVKVANRWRFAAFDGDEGIKPEEITAELNDLQTTATQLEQFTNELNSGKYKSEAALRNVLNKKIES